MTTIVEKTNMTPESPIQKFYSGQSIFITGGTGFVGKLLIEKLLRTCSNLSMVYLLIRPKKGFDAKQRLNKIFEDVVYDRLKQEVPKFREKVSLIEGDCSLPELGMSVEDKTTLLREISIIFHSAAAVNFDLNLRNAVITNVISTKQLMEMCKDMPKLKAVIYVSTAFSNSANPLVEEKFYEPPITYKNMIKIMESLSVEMLEKLKKELLGKYPDTYTFTKCISEQVVQDYGKNLPAGVFRPSMIMSTYKEPVEGWTNNIYGTLGLGTGIVVGVLRTIHGDKTTIADNVPADYTINALISTAWDVAHRKLNGMDPLVYNYTSMWNIGITWGEILHLCLKYHERTPTRKMIWYPTITVTKCWYHYTILRILLHLIPAFLIDGGLMIIGKKPKFRKLYRKIDTFMAVMSYYNLLGIKFSKQNVINLWDTLNEQDQKLFYFSMKNFDWNDYIKVALLWGKKYILHEEPYSIPQEKKRFQMLKILHYATKYIVLFLFAFSLFRIARNSWS